MKTYIAPNSSESRAQRRNPSLLNSKEESREISMVVIREQERGTLSLCVLFDRICFTESAEKRRLDK